MKFSKFIELYFKVKPELQILSAFSFVDNKKVLMRLIIGFHIKLPQHPAPILSYFTQYIFIYIFLSSIYVILRVSLDFIHGSWDHIPSIK